MIANGIGVRRVGGRGGGRELLFRVSVHAVCAKNLDHTPATPLKSTRIQCEVHKYYVQPAL